MFFHTGAKTASVFSWPQWKILALEWLCIIKSPGYINEEYFSSRKSFIPTTQAWEKKKNQKTKFLVRFSLILCNHVMHFCDTFYINSLLQINVSRNTKSVFVVWLPFFFSFCSDFHLTTSIWGNRVLRHIENSYWTASKVGYFTDFSCGNMEKVKDKLFNNYLKETIKVWKSYYWACWTNIQLLPSWANTGRNKNVIAERKKKKPTESKAVCFISPYNFVKGNETIPLVKVILRIS